MVREVMGDLTDQKQTAWDFLTREERDDYAWLAGIIDQEKT